MPAKDNNAANTSSNQRKASANSQIGSGLVFPVDPFSKQAITTWVVAALYQFKVVSDAKALQQQLQQLVHQWQLCGTLIVASEGINGTVSGARAGIDAMHQWLVSTAGFNNLEYKESHASEQPFKRMKVKHKKEIVTLGLDVAPTDLVGNYLTPTQWHQFIQDQDVLVIDTRNDYEYQAGNFKNAIDPNTESFSDFPNWVDQQLGNAKDKKIAMYCTGGIRCEKSTSLLLQKGFKEVYHLKGGILKYLEEIPAEQSLWQGDCFVFDDRVAVTHGVQVGSQVRCHSCGWSLNATELADPSYEKGVSCTHCINSTSAEQKARFRMRQAQYDRAENPAKRRQKTSSHGQPE